MGPPGASLGRGVQGRHDEAVAAARQARALEPLVLSFRTALSEVLLYADRYDEAEAEVARTLALDPDFRRGRTVGRWVLEARERWQEAADLGGRHGPADPGEWSRERYWRPVLDSLRGSSAASALDRAWAHAELGEAEPALTLIEQARAEGDGGLVLLGVAPQWDRIRDDPRFGRLAAGG